MSLKDLVEEVKAKLEQQYWLYQLNREVDELEHWIAEKEVVAGSPELGQDFEHVTVRGGGEWPVRGQEVFCLGVDWRAAQQAWEGAPHMLRGTPTPSPGQDAQGAQEKRLAWPQSPARGS